MDVDDADEPPANGTESDDVLMKEVNGKMPVKSEENFIDQNNQNILNENVESRGSCGSDDSMWRPW
jgi:hypothetical protein